MECVEKSTTPSVSAEQHIENKAACPRASRALNIISMILALVVAVYVDRHYIAPIDFGWITQCICDPLTCIDWLYPSPTPLFVSDYGSHYEITTYDPFIDGIFNGSKTMIFMSDTARYDNRSVCDEIEDMRGEIVTLRSYKNQSSPLVAPRVITGVRVKRVVHVNIITEIIGDISMNCGYCEGTSHGSVLFCKISKTSDVYARFAHGLSPHVIIETIFVAYSFTNKYHWWLHNDRAGNARICGGYSVADIDGYYFIFGERIQTVDGDVQSHINHQPMPRYKLNDQFRQCFVEIELVR